MIRKRIGAPCESGASVRCWHGGGKPTAAAWVSTGGWSNGRWRGCISFVGYECAGSGEPKSMRPSSTSDVYSSVGTTSKSFVRNSKGINIASANLPTFFEWAYAPDVLRFLLTSRGTLRWRDSKVDRTLMAFILIHLHGKRLGSLSNQMRDSKAMAPDYAVRWWIMHEMRPPNIDPLAFLEQRIERRYKKGTPDLAGEVLLGDSVQLLNSNRRRRAFASPFDLLFTSPPYYGVTNYHYDQWLRLWMLGHDPTPRWRGSRWQRKFQSRSDYRDLLAGVFKGAALRLHDNAIVVVRTDAREFTHSATVEALKEAFPNKALCEEPRPIEKQTQTALYGDTSEKPGEVDIIMTPDK